MLQVGSLFNQRAGDKEEEEKTKQRKLKKEKQRHEKILSKQLRKKLNGGQDQIEDEVSSSDDSLDEEDPEISRMI